MNRRKITICTTVGIHQVMAMVFGTWAVHLVTDAEPLLGVHCNGWRVTHVASGVCISNHADGMAYEDAVRVACALEESGEDPYNPDARYVMTAVIGAALETPS